MKFPSSIVIATMPFGYVMDVDETTENMTLTGGLESEFVEVLAQYLNFEYRVVTPKDREWGTMKDDGHWSGLVGMVLKEEADLAISALSITEERQKFVDFVPYRTEATTFATSIPEEKPNMFFYINIFDYKIWVACLCVLLILPLLYVVMGRNMRYLLVFYKHFATLMKQQGTIALSNTKVVYLFGSWEWFALFITLAYGGVMLSFMTVPVRMKGVETLKQLLEAIENGKYTCYAFGGSSDIEFLKASDNIYIQSIGKHIEKNKWLFSAEKKAVITQNMAIIGYRSLLRIEQNAGVGIKKNIFEENIAVWHAGIAVRKNFCCNRSLSIVVGRIMSSGIFQRFYEIETFRTRMNPGEDHQVYQNSERSLTVRDFTGVFMLLGIGYVFSIAALMFEYMYYNMKNKKTL